jgi:hypothetical protein
MNLVVVFLAASHRRYFWQHRRSVGNAFKKRLGRIYNKMGRCGLFGAAFGGRGWENAAPHTEFSPPPPQGLKIAWAGRRLGGSKDALRTSRLAMGEHTLNKTIMTLRL